MPKVLFHSTAMMCPAMGRGAPGEIAVMTDGTNVRAVWVSEWLDVTGNPMFNCAFLPDEFAHARPRFGGRIDCRQGDYLLFGKKRVAAEFLAVLNRAAAAAAA